MTVAGYMLLAGPPRTARVYPITSQHALIGRDRECHLRLVYPSVSRKHCEIWADGDTIMVLDLMSNNGTFVNGTKVQCRRLGFGDLLQVGPLVLQVVRAHAAHEDVFDAVGDEDFEAVEPQVSAPTPGQLNLSRQEAQIVRLLVDGSSEKEVGTNS